MWFKYIFRDKINISFRSEEFDDTDGTIGQP